MPANRIDVLGKKFGQLTVLEVTGQRNKANSPLYRCRCSCGNTVLRAATKLLGSANPACLDCQKPHNYGKPRTAQGESGFNSLYGNYRKGAERRQLAFELTKWEFRELTVQNCIYCGERPCLIKYGSHGLMKEHGAYTYNGIDRINSDKGYTKENSVTCCHVCNMMKSDLTREDFILQMKRILKFLNTTL